jgi:hypothetical protein
MDSDKSQQGSPKVTAWERFASKMAALGIDPLGPPIGENDPRFDEVQAIIAEFGGDAPLPPLPPNWEGLRPVDFDGTFAGIGRWLDFEWWQIIAKTTFPGAGQTSLAHLNVVIRNAYRAFAYFQVANPPKRAARATEIAVARERVEALVAFIRSKLRSGWQSPITDQPKAGKIEIAKWADLGIGIDDDWTYYAFSPCPENGEKVKLKNAMILPLKGKTRWPKVLPCFARSDDGKTADQEELAAELGYYKKGDVTNAQAFDAGMVGKAKAVRDKLRITMADLGEILRRFIATDKTKVFESNGDYYRTEFTTRHLFRDDDGYVTFGRLQ